MGMGFDISSFSPYSLARSVKNTVWSPVSKAVPSPSPVSKVVPAGTFSSAVNGGAFRPVMANVVGDSFIKLAGISGAIAVMMGAYGAHVFLKRKDVPDELKDVFRTGSQYHFLHTLALLAMPLVKRPLLVGSLISSGMLIFCGTCYVYSMTGDKRIGRAAPYGGTLLILGWLSMLI